MFIGEISNPWLVIRTLLKIKGDKNSLLYNINEIIFMVSFLVLRMIIGPVVTYKFFEYE